MGVLDKFKLVEMKRKAKPNVAQQRRTKLIEQLQEQLKMAEAMLNGTTYERTKTTWAKDAEGNRVRIEKQVRVRAWWEVTGNAVQFGLPNQQAAPVADGGKIPLQVKINAQRVSACVRPACFVEGACVWHQFSEGRNFHPVARLRRCSHQCIAGALRDHDANSSILRFRDS